MSIPAILTQFHNFIFKQIKPVCKVLKEIKLMKLYIMQQKVLNILRDNKKDLSVI